MRGDEKRGGTVEPRTSGVESGRNFLFLVFTFAAWSCVAGERFSWQWRMHFRYRQNRTALSLLTLFRRIAGLFLLLAPAFVYQHAQRPTNAVIAF
jgi:hypothetical protein